MDPEYVKKQKREVVKRQDVLYGKEACVPSLSSSFLIFFFLIDSTGEPGLHCRPSLRPRGPLHLLPSSQGSWAFQARDGVAGQDFVRISPQGGKWPNAQS